MSAAGIDGYDTRFDTKIGDDNDDDSGVIASESKPVKLELALRIKHAKIIALYDKAVHPCCSCNRLFQKKGSTVVRFFDKILLLYYRGDTFRKAFTELGEIRSLIPSQVRVMTLTATATKATRHAVCHLLGMQSPHLVYKVPNRTNISM